MNRLTLSLVTAFAFLLVAAPAHSADADLKADLAKWQGKWKGKLTVDEGASTWTLDVKGNKSRLTIKDKDGDEVLKADCEFKLEQHGKFRAFTYTNLKFLSGESEGKTELTDGKSRASLYKFGSSTELSTIGGFREDSEEDQWLIKWEKE